MDKSTVTVAIPIDLYERAEALADSLGCSAESLMLDSLKKLFATTPDIELELEKIQRLDDQNLIAIVYQSLAMPQRPRLRELIDLAKSGRATGEEIAEMEQLHDMLDRNTLLRSEALLQLKLRGQDVEELLKLGA